MVEPCFFPPHDTSHNIMFPLDTFLRSSERSCFFFVFFILRAISHGPAEELLIVRARQLCFVHFHTCTETFTLRLSSIYIIFTVLFTVCFIDPKFHTLQLTFLQTKKTWLNCLQSHTNFSGSSVLIFSFFPVQLLMC